AWTGDQFPVAAAEADAVPRLFRISARVSESLAAGQVAVRRARCRFHHRGTYHRGCAAGHDCVAKSMTLAFDLPENAFGQRKRLHVAADILRTRSPKTVLDVGCGSGQLLTLPLAKNFPNV